MLTLSELQTKQVEAKRKKYEKDEMDAYLTLVFDNYKQLLEANTKLEEEKKDLNKKIKTLSDGVQYYRSIETTLQKALILAEKTSKETKDAAIEKATAIEKDAHTRAKHILQKAENEYKQIKVKYDRMVQQFEEYKQKLKEATKAQMSLLEGEEFNLAPLNMDGVFSDIASSETTTETLSSTPDVAPTPSVSDAVEEDVVVEDIAETVEEKVMTETPLNSTTVETAKEEVVATLNEDISVDTSKEELLNADTIDLRDTYHAVTAATEPAAVEAPKQPVVTQVKEATVVEPVYADTVTAATTIEAVKEAEAEPLDKISDTSNSVPEASVQLEPVTSEPIQMEVESKQNQETDTVSPASSVPTLDSLLQDLNINNKGNKNSDDPFEFLGSIDDDF